jgi:hypothetical protein
MNQKKQNDLQFCSIKSTKNLAEDLKICFFNFFALFVIMKSGKKLFWCNLHSYLWDNLPGRDIS